MPAYIDIGAYGWDHDAWQDSFYPDDLPADWRFTYYAKLFRCTLVPAQYDEKFTAADWQEWVEESPDDFEFILELPALACASLSDTERWLESRQVFQQKLRGFYISFTDATREYDSRSVDYLNQSGFVVFSGDEQSVDSGSDPELDGQFFPLWQTADQVSGSAQLGEKHAHPTSPVAMLADGQPGDLRALGKYMQQFQAANKDFDTLYLIFKGMPPDIQQMQDAQTVVSLLDTEKS